MTAPIAKIAIVGAGAIGRRHAGFVTDHAGCTLAAMVDPAPQCAEDFGEICPVFSDLAEMLKDVQPDGVILATPNRLHLPQALLCVDADTPTLVEKPVTETVQEAERLRDASAAKGVPVIVGHHRRHSAYMKAAAQIVKSGALGSIVAATGSYLLHKPDADGYFSGAPWRTKPGGGPLLINAIHDIDNLRALCGEIVQVQAITSNQTRKFEVEDTAVINLRFESGALGTLIVSDCVTTNVSWEQTTVEDPVFTTTQNHRDDCYLIAGTDGTLGVPTMTMTQYRSDKDKSWKQAMERSVTQVDRVDPLVAQLDHFLRVIDGTEEPLVTVEDGLANLKVIEAIKVSSETGQIVEL